MNSQVPNPPHDPDARNLPWWRILAIILVDDFKSRGRRWWIQWAIGIVVFGSLAVGVVLYCYFFPDSLLLNPPPNR